MIGKTLGNYEIIEQIGAGGMGEVYRARDTRLDRIVAIKVLPSDLAGEAQFRQRFEREARAISNLSHPNICTLHDVGEENGVHYLVMECLEGEPLDQSLKKGPLPLDELLKTAVQIADALEAAHRQGVVHRDLKPGNVMMTRDGAKLLDFGLAKSEATEDTGTDLTATPTVASPLTAEGTIVGTYQYMAPEQIEGQDVDVRSDIFAFGAMLYEMATGKKAFQGKTQASLLASILKETPRPVSELQPLTPPALERVIKVCLEKDPDNRPRSAHDLKLQLKWIQEGGSQAGLPVTVQTRRKSRERIAWIISGVLLLVAIGLGTRLVEESKREESVVRAFIPPPNNGTFDTEDTHPGPASISPDGRLIVFVMDEGGEQLWLRPVDSQVAQPLSGTEGAAYPFWSPDSRTIGFFADQKLRKIDAGGGPPLTLCEAGRGKGGTWNEDGAIVFAPSHNTGLHRVAAAGGESVAITELDSLRGDDSHRFPEFLPDGHHVLYLARGDAGGEDAEGAIFVRSLEDGEEQMLMAAQSQVTLANGHLLFVREHTLMARKFDHKGLEFTGDAFPLAEQVEYLTGAVYAAFSASKNGVLIYQVDREEPVAQLTWLNRQGLAVGTVGTPGLFDGIAVSPDGSSIAAELNEGSEFSDIWMIDTDRGVRSRFTFDAETDINPVWSPDGSRIVFASNRSEKLHMYSKSVEGTENEVLLLDSEGNESPTDWSRDGEHILYSSNQDIWALPTTGDREPFPVVQTEFPEWAARFSPDGKWIVYASTESGRPEIYAMPFPGPGRKWQISTEGGLEAFWNDDEIIYASSELQIMSVDVEASGGALRVGSPEPLFELEDRFSTGTYSTQRDLFLIGVMVEVPQPAPLVLVVNWTEELKDR